MKVNNFKYIILSAPKDCHVYDNFSLGKQEYIPSIPSCNLKDEWYVPIPFVR